MPTRRPSTGRRPRPADAPGSRRGGVPVRGREGGGGGVRAARRRRQGGGDGGPGRADPANAVLDMLWDDGPAGDPPTSSRCRPPARRPGGLRQRDRARAAPSRTATSTCPTGSSAALTDFTIATWVNRTSDRQTWSRRVRLRHRDGRQHVPDRRRGRRRGAVGSPSRTNGGGGEQQVTAPGPMPTGWHTSR